MKYEQAIIKAIELKYGVQASLEIQIQAFDLLTNFVTLKHKKASQDFLEKNPCKDGAARQRKSRFMRPLNASLKTQLAMIKINRDKIGLDNTKGIFK